MPKHYPLNRPLLSNAKMFGHSTVARYQVSHTALQHRVNKKYLCIYLHSEYNLTFNWCLVPALHPVQDIIDKVLVFTSWPHSSVFSPVTSSHQHLHFIKDQGKDATFSLDQPRGGEKWSKSWIVWISMHGSVRNGQAKN